MAEVCVDLNAEATSPTQTYGRVVDIEGANPQPRRDELFAIDGKCMNLVFDPTSGKCYATFNTTFDLKGNDQGKGATNLTFQSLPDELAARVKVGKKIKIRIYHED